MFECNNNEGIIKQKIQFSSPKWPNCFPFNCDAGILSHRFVCVHRFWTPILNATRRLHMRGFVTPNASRRSTILSIYLFVYPFVIAIWTYRAAHRCKMAEHLASTSKLRTKQNEKCIFIEYSVTSDTAFRCQPNDDWRRLKLMLQFEQEKNKMVYISLVWSRARFPIHLAFICISTAKMNFLTLSGWNYRAHSNFRCVTTDGAELVRNQNKSICVARPFALLLSKRNSILHSPDVRVLRSVFLSTPRKQLQCVKLNSKSGFDKSPAHRKASHVIKQLLKGVCARRFSNEHFLSNFTRFVLVFWSLLKSTNLESLRTGASKKCKYDLQLAPRTPSLVVEQYVGRRCHFSVYTNIVSTARCKPARRRRSFWFITPSMRVVPCRRRQRQMSCDNIFLDSCQRSKAVRVASAVKHSTFLLAFGFVTFTDWNHIFPEWQFALQMCLWTTQSIRLLAVFTWMHGWKPSKACNVFLCISDSQSSASSRSAHDWNRI